jgi:hypothetical protein
VHGVNSFISYRELHGTHAKAQYVALLAGCPEVIPDEAKAAR